MSELKVNEIEPQSGSTVSVTGLVAPSATLAAPTITDGTITDTAITTDDVTITGGAISGITDLAVADGGTGASTAGGALTNLGVSAFIQTLVDDADAATARSTLGVADATLSVDRFSGDGVDTTFTLSADPGSENNTQVYIDGVYQQKDQYSVAGTTLTFSAAPPTGTDNIEVVLGRTAAIGTPGAATVGADELDTTAITGQTEDTAPDKSADFLLSYDTSAGALKKVLPSRFGPVLGTMVAATSGTSIDFTNIPSWVTKITLMMDGVSISGAANLIIQIGDSGGIETTGYQSAGTTVTDAAQATSASTVGYFLGSGGASSLHTGAFVLTLMDAATNMWIMHGNMTVEGGGRGNYAAGKKSLSGTLDRVRWTTTNGTDTFDAGAVNIQYE